MKGQLLEEQDKLDLLSEEEIEGNLENLEELNIVMLTKLVFC